jgi:signal transduction histidine kinase
MMSRFLENMGRKVRTPLNAVMGFSDVMSEEESEEARRTYRKIIDENSALLIRMADDMLTLAQLESGDYVFNRASFKVSETLEEIKKSFLKKRPDANIVIHPIDGDFSVTLDRARVCDVITTVLNYYEIYTKGGTITIDYEIKDKGVSVSLSDPSLFIEEEIVQYLFERFENFDKSSKYIPGLGLPICKAILSNDNGRMVVDSTPEKGTAFQFWIPCETKR